MKTKVFVLNLLGFDFSDDKWWEKKAEAEGALSYLTHEITDDLELYKCETIAHVGENLRKINDFVEKNDVEFPIICFLGHGKENKDSEGNVFATQCGEEIDSSQMREFFQEWTANKNLILLFCTCYGSEIIKMIGNIRPHKDIYYGVVASKDTINMEKGVDVCNYFLKSEIKEIEKEERTRGIIDIVREMNAQYDATNRDLLYGCNPFRAWNGGEQKDYTNFLNWMATDSDNATDAHRQQVEGLLDTLPSMLLPIVENDEANQK